MALDEFYDQYAEKKTADEWFDEFGWGSGNNDEAVWMEK